MMGDVPIPLQEIVFCEGAQSLIEILRSFFWLQFDVTKV
jgi:hypothetical protein